MRARTRSPMPATGSVSRLPSTMRMRGAAPFASSHAAGRAMNSPSASRAVTSITVTGGSTPGRVNLRREPAISPSSAISRSKSFSAIRSPPLTPKARAISRLPASLLAVAKKSRMSCRDGSFACRLLARRRLEFRHRCRSARRLLDGLLIALSSLAGRLLGRRVLGRPLALAGPLLWQTLAALSAIRATASSSVTCSGSRSRGSVALILPCLT